MENKRKKGSGGKRVNSGRKSPYKEKTKVLGIRVPISEYDTCKQVVYDYLAKIK